MTQHVYKYCMDYMVTESKCCPDGLHRTDCKLIPVIEGHNKERMAKYDADRPFTMTDFLMTVLAVSFTAFAVLWTINGGFQP